MESSDEPFVTKYAFTDFKSVKELLDLLSPFAQPADLCQGQKTWTISCPLFSH